VRVVILEPAMDDLRAGRRFYAPEYGEGLQATGAGPRSPSGMESGSTWKGAEGE